MIRAYKRRKRAERLQQEIKDVLQLLDIVAALVRVAKARQMDYEEIKSSTRYKNKSDEKVKSEKDLSQANLVEEKRKNEKK